MSRNISGNEGVNPLLTSVNCKKSITSREYTVPYLQKLKKEKKKRNIPFLVVRVGLSMMQAYITYISPNKFNDQNNTMPNAKREQPGYCDFIVI